MNLAQADLTGAKMTDADVTGCNLTDAVFDMDQLEAARSDDVERGSGSAPLNRTPQRNDAHLRCKMDDSAFRIAARPSKRLEPAHERPA